MCVRTTGLVAAGVGDDLYIRTDAEGVWLGFFASDGKVAVVNLDKITASLPEGSISRAALDSWKRDRGIALDNGR